MHLGPVSTSWRQTETKWIEIRGLNHRLNVSQCAADELDVGLADRLLEALLVESLSD